MADIEVMKDGPYIVKGAKSLKGPGGETMAVNERIALCRCGHSNNKPFCDGSHRASGFKG